MRVTDIVFQWEDTRGMQIGIDIGNESDGYCLTVGVPQVMHVGITGSESDEYRLTVGGYSEDVGRY